MGSEKISKRYQASSGDSRQDAKTKPQKQRDKSSNLTAYWILAFLRVLLILLPQTGYIHPDEYFQSVEVIAGDVFDLEVERPWEFNITFPIRSILLPKIIYGIPYVLLYVFTPDLNAIFGWDIRTPYVMLVLPRLIACALSFVTDYCLYKICLLYGQKYRSRLLILATSYVTLIYGTRTLSNNLEMALMSVLLYLVADCMIVSDRVIYQEEFLDRKYSSSSTPVERTKLYKMRAALPSHSLRRCFSIATIVVAGVFNRPTFLAFGLAPVFFWLQRGISSKYSGIRAFHVRIFVFSFCALPALFVFILADSFYYGHLTWNEIGMGDVNLKSFVVTPFNFLLYNSQKKNLAHHGLHPRVTHLFLNIPLLYNVLGFTGIIAVSNFLVRASQARWRELPRAQSLMMLMTASFLIPVLLLSLVPHQEARFLIPITLPLVFLHAQEIRDMDTKPALKYIKQESIQDKRKSSLNTQTSVKRVKQSKKSLMYVWVTINCLLAFFFGFVHQGGIYPLTAHIKEVMRKQSKPQVLHLVTNYLYPIPQSLLVQRNSHHEYYDPVLKTKYLVARKFYAHELGSMSLPDVFLELRKLLMEAKETKRKENMDYVVYLAIPSSMADYLSVASESNLTFIQENIFYPHMSTEALPYFRLWARNSETETNSKECSEGIVNKSGDPRLPCYVPSSTTSEDSATQRVLKFLSQFSLLLFRVKLSV